jgi:deoxycytidylate deaminase
VNAKDVRMFSKAEEVSECSGHYKFKIGSIISKGRKIISSGFNSLQKTHPIQAQYAQLVGRPEAIFLHAEMAALVEANSKGIDTNGAEIYVFRRGLAGDIRMARPCKICMRALIEHGIRKIHYTTDFGYAKEEIIK